MASERADSPLNNQETSSESRSAGRRHAEERDSVVRQGRYERVYPRRAAFAGRRWTRMKDGGTGCAEREAAERKYIGLQRAL